MKSKTITLFIIALILTVTFTIIIKSKQTKAYTLITPDSSESPIQKYFSTKKIIWTLDDYYIHLDHHPPHKGFDQLTKKITSYDGHVNIMVIFTTDYYTNEYNNEIRNYSVIDDFGWLQNKINNSLEFFKQKNIYPQSHGWNHSAKLNNASLKYAYQIINHTLWNWENNYNIKPNFFIGHSTSGNYNITIALKKFSENYWPVYGENFRWYDPDLFPNPSLDAPAIDYLGKGDYVTMFDPLFGMNWGNPCKNLEEAINLFIEKSENKEIIFIRGHPAILNSTDEKTSNNIKLWEDWIDWIYQENNLININHTQAIYYIADRDNFKVFKNKLNEFIIDLSDCSHSHNILFSQPYQDISVNWTVINEEGKKIGEVYRDEFIELEEGKKYTITTSENIETSNELYQIVSEVNNEASPGFELTFFIIVLFLVLIGWSRIKKNDKFK